MMRFFQFQIVMLKKKLDVNKIHYILAVAEKDDFILKIYVMKS